MPIHPEQCPTKVKRRSMCTSRPLYPRKPTFACAAISVAMGQKATWLRSSGLECFAKLCDHRQRYCGAVVPVTRLALVAFGVFGGTGHAPR